MSEKFYWNDFSAGWCPSDDPLNGRPNALLRMENVELDSNGGLIMSGGTVRQLSVFTNTLHSLYQKYIGATSYIYSGDTAGVVFRNNASIKTSGSTTRAAFGAAFNYVFGFSGNKRFRDDGTTTTDLGIIKPSAAPTVATGATGILTGDYEYAQINVYKNGTYEAKSARGTISAVVSPALQVVTVTPQDPSVPSSTATEVWIFRRGVNLDQWYRVAKRTTYAAFSDNMSDADALALNIIMNDWLLSVNSTDTTDAILACVGPIYGRMIYCTATQIIASDRYSPDSYDSRTVFNIGSAASGAEVFKWSLKVSKNAILIGTNRDVYILSGTWVQLPDGFLDISLDPLGVTDPPIGIDVALYRNSAIYMSKSGWVACAADGEIVNLCFPNTDFVYKGHATLECGPTTIDLTGATRYPIAINKNKLFCVVPVGAPIFAPATSSIHTEVYDFLRKYWRVSYIDLSPKMYTSTEDGTLIGFDDTDKYVKIYDASTSVRLDDGSATRQIITVVSKCFDLDSPDTRKDFFSLLIIGGTGSSLFGFIPYMNLDGHDTGLTNGDVTFTAFKVADTGFGFQAAFLHDYVSLTGAVPAKQFQFKLIGQSTDLRFKGYCLSYELRPKQHTFVRLQNLGLDSSSKKRVRTIPLILDTLGNNVVFTPTIDGVAGVAQTFNTTRKQTVIYYFTTDAFGVDFSGILTSGLNQPFEFYNLLPPDVTYVQPTARKFSTVGEIEVFKYGKIKKVSIRLASIGETAIPYTIYEDNVSVASGTLTVVTNVEDIYDIDMPKTVGGSLLKIDFGPVTTGTFRHIGTKIQYIKLGNQTEETWISLEGKQVI